jgi:hypothetical protein
VLRSVCLVATIAPALGGGLLRRTTRLGLGVAAGEGDLRRLGAHTGAGLGSDRCYRAGRVFGLVFGGDDAEMRRFQVFASQTGNSETYVCGEVATDSEDLTLVTYLVL